MPINYVRTIPKLSNHLYDDKASFVVMDMCPEIRTLDIGNRFRQIDPAVRATSNLVFRVPSLDYESIIRNDIILKYKLIGKKVGIIGPKFENDQFSMEYKLVQEGSDSNEPIPTEKLKQVETQSILNQSGAILFPERSHYVLPSGVHSNGFINISKALSDQISISRISDWVMPFVTQETGIIIDTPSMIPLALQVSLAFLSKSGVQIPYSVLRGYPNRSLEVVRRIQELRDSYGCSQLLFLLSVNSSGALASKFKQYSSCKVTVLALCHTWSEESQFLDAYLAKIPITRWDLKSRGRCVKCSSLERIIVDRQTLEPTPADKIEPLKTNIRLARKKQLFWKALSRTDSAKLHVSVHYEDEQQPVRHHAVYIETSKICNDHAFRRKCLNVIRQLGAFNLVIIPQHRNCKIVSDLISEALSFNMPRIEIVKTADLHSVLVHYPSCRRILIADDGIVSGATLRTFRDLIYQFYQPTGKVPSIDGFVIVARPDSPSAFQSVKLPFIDDKGEHIHYGELVYLPHDIEECPWCQELELLNQYRNTLSGKVKNTLEKRIKQLEGEVQKPLLVNNVEDLKTLKSFFGELKIKAAFVAMSSVTQELKNSVENDNDPFKHKVIDIPFVLKAYFETVFPAALLRSVSSKYCRIAEIEQDLERFIQDHPSKYSYPGIIAELGWAALLGKLPLNPIIGLLKQFRSTDEFVELVYQLLLIDNGLKLI